MDQELKSMLEAIITNQEALNTRFDGVDNKLEGISNQLDRIEAESNDDIIAVLESINGKMEALATKEDIDYLAEKLGRHDIEIDRLKRVK